METKAKKQVTPSHTHTQTPQLTSRLSKPKFYALDFGNSSNVHHYKEPMKRETFEAHNAKRECQKTVDAYTQSTKLVNYAVAK